MNGAVLKTVESGYSQLRGFESHTLLQRMGNQGSYTHFYLIEPVQITALIPRHAALAQMVEQGTFNPKGVGSNPTGGTNSVIQDSNILMSCGGLAHRLELPTYNRKRKVQLLHPLPYLYERIYYVRSFSN